MSHPEPATRTPSTTADSQACLRERSDDRLLGLAVLLPVEPREPVVLAARAEQVTALRRRFPRALTQASDPLPQEIGFLFVDSTVVGPAVTADLCARVGPLGTAAVIGGHGRHLVYPSSELPEQVWAAGWPLPEMHGTRAHIRRTVGILTANRRATPRLCLEGVPVTVLADLIAEDLAAAIGGPVVLVGVVAAGQTILRFRPGARGRSDVAVRLSFDPEETYLAVEDQVVADVPAVARFVAPRLAAGRTAGLPWVANVWVPRRRGVAPTSRRRIARLIDELVTELEAVPTGRTAPGWAVDWLTHGPHLPAAIRPRLAAALAPLERGLATGWCHGDLWGANVLVGRGPDGNERGVAIDWDNAARDAPVGIDRLLVAALREGDVSAACRHLVDDRRFTAPVAERRWWDWDRDTRVGLAVAAYLLHLRNRAGTDLSVDGLDADLAQLGRLVPESDEAHHHDQER